MKVVFNKIKAYEFFYQNENVLLPIWIEQWAFGTIMIFDHGSILPDVTNVYDSLIFALLIFYMRTLLEKILRTFTNYPLEQVATILNCISCFEIN